MENGKDPLTQEIFRRKRTNQKFVRAENRIRYNNNKARKKRSAKAFIDRKLDHNRNILDRILGDRKEVTVSRDYLLGSGFSFDYFNYQKEVDKHMYAGIYEFGVTKVDPSHFKITKLSNE